MLYQNFTGIIVSELEGGGGTTIANTPYAVDLFWLFYLGQMCYRVTSSPGVNEYTLVGTTMQLGFTKEAADELYSWTEPLNTRVLIPATISGTIDGINRIYTIAETIPATTEPLLFHNGMALNPTGTGVNHYARSGQTFTLNAAHPAPEVEDQLFIWVAVTNSTSESFHALTLSQPVGMNAAYLDVGLMGVPSIAQYLLAHVNTRVFTEIELNTTPAYGEIRHYPVSGYVQFPFAVSLSTDKLRVWEVGANESVLFVFDSFLAQNLPRVLFAELHLAKIGSTKILRVATEDIYAQDPDDGNTWQEWKSQLKGGVTITKALPDSFTGLVVTSYGSLELVNQHDATGTRQLDSDFAATSGYSTFGQGVKVWLGGHPIDARHLEGLPFGEKLLVLTGQMLSASRSWSRVSIPLKDGSLALQRKTTHTAISITDFPAAPEETLGQSVPRHLGTVHNYQPILVDPGYLIYCVGYVVTILAVYDNGYPIPFSLFPLALAGDPFTVWTITLLSQPVGTVTCDVVGGSITGGDWPDPAYLPDWLLDLARAAGLTANIAQSQHFIEAYPYEIGYVIAEPTAYDVLIETLLAGILGFYEILPDNSFRLGVVEPPAGKGSVVKIDGYDEAIGTDWTLTERVPTWKTAIAYNNNETVMTSGVAYAVSLARKEFLKNPYQSVEYKDNPTHATFADAVEETLIQTRIVKKADALALATKRIQFLKTPRQIWQGRLPLSVYNLALGDIIDFEFTERYGMGSTQWLVSRKTWNLVPGDAPSYIEVQLLK